MMRLSSQTQLATQLAEACHFALPSLLSFKRLDPEPACRRDIQASAGAIAAQISATSIAWRRALLAESQQMHRDLIRAD